MDNNSDLFRRRGLGLRDCATCNSELNPILCVQLQDGIEYSEGISRDSVSLAPGHPELF